MNDLLINKLIKLHPIKLNIKVIKDVNKTNPILFIDNELAL